VVRILFALYLGVMFGPLVLAVVAWSLRNGLKAVFKTQAEAEEAGTDGSVGGLLHTVEEVRATGG